MSQGKSMNRCIDVDCHANMCKNIKDTDFNQIN